MTRLNRRGRRGCRCLEALWSLWHVVNEHFGTTVEAAADFLVNGAFFFFELRIVSIEAVGVFRAIAPAETTFFQLVEPF